MLANAKKDAGCEELDAPSKALVMAVGIVFDRVSRLSPEDKADLFELAKALHTAKTREDWVSAQNAMLEILDHSKVAAIPLPMHREAARSEGLKKWVNHVGTKVRELRKAQGLTQERLAELSALPQSHISKLENGEHSPSHKTVDRLAEALGVDAGKLDPTR
jgi:ribosome-binding protein aMBF1 (putative translation factor)